MAAPHLGNPPRPLMDPKTRDWVIVRGQRAADDTHASEVLYALQQHLGSSPAYPDAGSALHTNQTITEKTPDAVRHQVGAALAHLLADGRITGLVVDAQQTATARVRLLVKWNDTKGKARRLLLEIG